MRKEAPPKPWISSPSRNVDYVADAMTRLPFPDKTFDVVYASHVLEHLPWFHTEAILREWRRVLKPLGRLEVWVPGGQFIAEVLLTATGGEPHILTTGGE